MSTHAKLSPSSSDRWLACPASILRAPETEEEASEYALEGTAAHALAEHCLRKGITAAAAVFPADHAAFDSAEMRAHVQTYLDYVKGQMVPGAELFVEQKLQIFMQYEVWGTADAVIVTPDGIIKIIDLKYGKGILVDSEDNTQLTLYAIGGLSFDWLSKVPVHTVEAHIVQPRRNSFPSVSQPVTFLANWTQENVARVIAAHAGTDIANPGTHCKWCPVKGVCKERAEANLALASFDFAAFEPACPSYEGLSEPELVKVFLHIKQIRDYLDDVEAEVAKRAHAGPVDGVKWVAGRVARKITNFELAANALRAAGIEPYKPAPFIGITDIEKELKVKGLKFIDMLKGCFEVIAGKPALVPATDKRDAITPEAAAAADFK